MLSYRHAYHAGNHADVLKHYVLVQLLRYLNQKDKPYWVADTHAGAGIYALDKGYAARNAEHADGIARIWNSPDAPASVADYLDLVKSFNPDGQLRQYPGSPYLAMRLLREQDRLRLFELHGTDNKLLREHFARDFPDDAKRVAIGQADGFLSLKSVLPPPPRRGLTLIDPAYEDKRDYLRTVMTVKDGIARFATGTFAVWYPQLQRGEAKELPEKLKRLAPEWLHVTLTVQAPAADGFGMHGSGMFVVNPPWTLAATLAETLPWLKERLALDDRAAFAIETPQQAAPAAPRRKPR